LLSDGFQLKTERNPPRSAANSKAALTACFLAVAALFVLARPVEVSAASQSKKMPAIPKWGRFEQSFKSAATYPNALQDATLTVLFISPLGETNSVYGFWDGGKVWRVRFSPNQPGRWTFKTACSDAANKGLHNQSGEFLCTAASGWTRFNQHGAIRVARDHLHFEHADGTPFFWLADTAWTGPVMAEAKDWELYARTRAAQKFTVVQWAAIAGTALKARPAYTGHDHIAINPDYFRQLDLKLDLLAQTGILSAISPISNPDVEVSGTSSLPDDQAALLVRYVVARWGANAVAWLIPVSGSNEPQQVSRWKRIGPTCFATPRPPVILYSAEHSELFGSFKDQDWVDGFATQAFTGTTDASLKSALEGQFLHGWNKEPHRPIICFGPRENAMSPNAGKRFTSNEVRHSIYWSLLSATPAGVSYSAEGVSDWNTSKGSRTQEDSDSGLPLWQKSLFLPGAKQMSGFHRFVSSLEFWRLEPKQGFVANQPGTQLPGRFIAAGGTEARDLALVYTPEERTLEIAMEALPASPVVGWFNPRTGENSPAVAVVGGRTCQFPTPDPGDWVLVLKAGK
jgi:hypothetical protein